MQRVQDFARAFQQVVDYALEKSVDFVLLSGDFFHKRSINAQTLQQAVELLSPLRARGIPLIAIEGNHDKAFYQDANSWLGFLNNQGYLILLTPFFQEGRLILEPWEQKSKRGSWLDLHGARIYGAGYLGVTTAGRLEEILPYLQKDKEMFTILMLHAAVDKYFLQEIGGVKSEVLKPFRSKVDYLALGHVHSRDELDGWIYNPGSLECVHLDEFSPGKEKGFYHVTVKEGKQQVKYIPSSYRPVFHYAVDLSGSLDAGDVYEMLSCELAKNRPSAGAQVQIRLHGQIPYNPLSLDANSLSSRIKEEFSLLYADILNLTNLPAAGSLETGSLVKREEIEKHVFGQLLLREKNWQVGELEQAVNVVKKIKEMAAAGAEEEELINFLVQVGEKLVREDAPLVADSPEADLPDADAPHTDSPGNNSGEEAV